MRKIYEILKGEYCIILGSDPNIIWGCIIRLLNYQFVHRIIIFLINTHILKNWCARCNCKLWSASWFCYVFLRILTIIHVFSNLSQIVFLTNIHNLICPCVRYDCLLFKVIRFKCFCLGIFKYYYIFETLYLH